MGLGDLLNLDYGFALDGGPGWDFGTLGYSLGGPELSNVEILSDQFGMGPMRGVDFSLGVEGIDGTEMRPSVFEFSADGTPQALGFRGMDGTVQTLDGNRIAANPFNINQAGGSSMKGLMDAIKGVTSGGSGGSGGGNAAFSFPRLDVGESPEVAPHPVPGVPQTPAPTPFTPMNVDTRVPEGESRGLEALLRRLR